MLKTLITTLIACWIGPASAQAAPGDTAPAYTRHDGDYTAASFRLGDGSILPNVKLHYVTLGSPKLDPDGHVTNAVLVLHGTTGTSAQFLVEPVRHELFGIGQPLDASRYYVILPDALGHGGSSKPSDGLQTRFPHYGYDDVVVAQHQLLMEGLHVDHLRLILGTSMGGMQTWMWGEKYPQMADALMPVASQPIAMAGRNWLWRQMIIGAIEADPDWHGGAYQKQPTQWLRVAPIFTLITGNAAQIQSKAPDRMAATKLYQASFDKFTSDDVNDILYWFRSSADYDPEPALDRIKARLYAVNFEDDLINAVDLHVMQRLVPRVPNGRYVEVPESISAYGHMGLSHPELWKRYLVELLASTVPAGR